MRTPNIKRPYVDEDWAVVIGGGRGIGRASALALANQGFNVVIAARNENEIGAVAAEIVSNGGRARALVLDATSNDASDEIAVAINGLKVTAFVYAAGYVSKNLLVSQSADEIENIIDINLTAFLRTVRPCLKSMIRRRTSSIVAIGSIAANRGFSGQAAYAASKAGLAAAVSVLASEYGRFGLRANTIAPGLIDPSVTESEETFEALNDIPLGRAGNNHEVANVVAFLCSEEASFVSNAVIPVTGGASF